MAEASGKHGGMPSKVRSSSLLLTSSCGFACKICEDTSCRAGKRRKPHAANTEKGDSTTNSTRVPSVASAVHFSHTRLTLKLYIDCVFPNFNFCGSSDYNSILKRSYRQSSQPWLFPNVQPPMAHAYIPANNGSCLQFSRAKAQAHVTNLSYVWMRPQMPCQRHQIPHFNF